MKAQVPLLSPPVVLLTVALLFSPSLNAQSAATLSGTVIDTSGSPVPRARISVKNLNTGQSNDQQADTVGHFDVSAPAPADIEISVTADGFYPKAVKVAFAPGTVQTLTLTLTAIPGCTPPPQPANLPNAPSSSQTGQPSLADLGFTHEQLQSNAKEQALLDKRTHMLKIHQKLGLITAAPLIATVVTSIGAGGKKTSSTDRTVHTVLGAVTGDLYFTTAYFAIRAPKPPGTPTRGPIRVHKALA